MKISRFARNDIFLSLDLGLNILSFAFVKGLMAFYILRKFQ